MQQIELLAPARDLACGKAAIDCGADAAYIGAARFGARAQAGNSLGDIEALVRHAHRYWARVYVTVNTLLHDDEVPEAVRLIHQCYDIGVDALIIQDVGLLECDLPPLPLIASTQMHNATPARVAFLQQVGFQRAILARELSLQQIQEIRRQTTIELESFVHGALCVSYSGQCYLSYAVGGRSGNRGECAQPCRRPYDLVDRNGDTLVRGRHLLSLRDLNLSAYLGELIDAGITAFKIEGRLKDRAYVMNVVSFYRQQIDRVLADRRLSRSSSGESRIDFAPDLHKTFNRGYTMHFLYGRAEPPGAIDSPKSIGEPLGKVSLVESRSFRLDTAAELHSGDGLCFFDRARTLRGTVITAVHGGSIYPDRMEGIEPGTAMHRNHDHAFLTQLEKSRPQRRIAVRLTLEETADGLSLTAADEDGNVATGHLPCDKVQAEKPEQALANAVRQLRKMGDSEFACTDLSVAWREAYFLPFSALNALRRDALERLVAERTANRPVQRRGVEKSDVPYPEKQLAYQGNVLNRLAAAFYRRHGVTEIEPAPESGLDMRGRVVMRTRYCIRHQLGACVRWKDGEREGWRNGRVEGQKDGRMEEHRFLEGWKEEDWAEPVYLVDEDGHRCKLRFDCSACEMEVVW